MRQAIRRLEHLVVLAESLLAIGILAACANQGNPSSIQVRNWLAGGVIGNSAGHVAAIPPAGASARARSAAEPTLDSALLYVVSRQDGESVASERDLANDTTLTATFDGSPTPPGIYPAAFRHAGKDYLLFFTSIRIHRYYVQGVLTTFNDDKGNPILDYGVGPEIKIFERAAASTDGTSIQFTQSTDFDTSAIQNFDWIAADVVYVYDEVHFLSLSSPCMTDDALYFTAGEGNTGLRIMKSALVGGAFAAPVPLSGALVERLGFHKVARLFINHDATRAYFSLLDNPIAPSDLGGPALPDGGSGGGLPSLFPYVCECDIGSNGRFGDAELLSLPSAVNHDDMNLLTDVTFDGEHDVLFVAHIAASVAIANDAGQDGYIAMSVMNSLETLPGWLGAGYVDSFTAVEASPSRMDISSIAAYTR